MSTPTCWCGEPATWFVPAVREFVCDDDLYDAEHPWVDDDDDDDDDDHDLADEMQHLDD